jgi:hypothetical protein
VGAPAQSLTLAMRIPFPKSIPLRPLLVFLSLVLLIQLIEGTDPEFAVLMLMAQVAAAVAFNRLGGMTHMAGAFCAFAILPNVTIPELTHLLFGQPGDYKLVHPLETAGVCALFYLCVMISALVVSSISHPQPLFDRIPFSLLEMRIVSGIASVLATAILAASLASNEPAENGSFLAAAHQLFPALVAISVMLSTYVRLKSTDGRSAMNWYVATLLVLAEIPGILGASKEGMLTPIFCWLIVVAAFGHRFSRAGTLLLFGFATVIWVVVYPFSQNARFPVREAETLSAKVDMIVLYFRDPSQFPDVNEESDGSGGFGTASSKIGIINRVSTLNSIDMLIGGDRSFGFTPIERYAPVLYTVIPHAIWPDKPTAISTNELGHKAGFPMADDDTTTGIAIGTPALFFDLGGWLALPVYSILGFTAFFFVSRRIVGSSLAGIWGLVPVGTEANGAPNCSLGTLFGFSVFFLGTLFMTVALLKIIGYVSQTLISRPISSKA